MDEKIKPTAGYDGLSLPYSPEAEQSVLGAVLLGGVLAALPNRGRKKRSGKRLVKSNKKKRPH